MRRLLLLLGQILTLVVALVGIVLVLGILLVVLGANTDNGLVEAILDAARFLAGPFKGLFDLDTLKQRVAVNYGIATVVYVGIGLAIARRLQDAGEPGKDG